MGPITRADRQRERIAAAIDLGKRLGRYVEAEPKPEPIPDPTPEPVPMPRLAQKPVVFPSGCARQRVLMADIRKAVAAYFDVSEAEMRGAGRTQRVVFPRQLAMFLCSEITQSGLPEIGRAMGGRDHTTALHAIRKIGAMQRNEVVGGHIDALRRIIRGEPASDVPPPMISVEILMSGARIWRAKGAVSRIAERTGLSEAVIARHMDEIKSIASGRVG